MVHLARERDEQVRDVNSSAFISRLIKWMSRRTYLEMMKRQRKRITKDVFILWRASRAIRIRTYPSTERFIGRLCFLHRCDTGLTWDRIRRLILASIGSCLKQTGSVGY